MLFSDLRDGMPERLVRTSPIPLVSMQDNAGEFHKFGWVMLNGKRETFRDAHTVSSTLADGYSVVGGWSVVQLENGLTLRIEVDAVDGVVTSTPLNNGGAGSSPAGIEVLSIPRWNGQAGVCDFNMIDNAHRGEQEVSGSFLANHQDGVSQRRFDASWIRYSPDRSGFEGIAQRS